MALKTLPNSPRPTDVQWQLQDFGNTQKGALGGQAQRINRLGARWGATVTMPPMSTENALAWSAALLDANSNGARWRISQPSVTIGTPGSVAINGAGQSGGSIICDGATSGYTIKAGQFINVTTNGDAYCYLVSGDATSDGSGNITIPIYPDLREEPQNNDPVEIASPNLEGLLAEIPSWIVGVDHIASGFEFTLQESK